MIAPEELQYVLGIHPDQIQASQAFAQASQGDPSAMQGGDQSQPPPPEPRPISTDKQEEKPDDSPDAKPLISAPKPNEPRSISAEPVSLPSREANVIPRSTGEMGPPAPASDAVPSGEVPGQKQDTSSISDLMTTPIRPPTLSPPVKTADQQQAEEIQQREAKNRARLSALEDGGSGISRFQHNHHILGPIIRGLEIAGSVVSPGTMRMVPGSTLNYNDRVNEAHSRVEGDLADDAKRAQTAHVQAEAQQLSDKPDKASPITDPAGEILGWNVNGETLGPNNPKLTKDQKDIMAAAHGKAPKDASPDVQTFAQLLKGDPEHGVAPMTHAQAFQKLQELKGENRRDSVDQQEMADYIGKHPGKGASDYAAWKASLAPKASNDAASAAAGGLGDAALDNAAEMYWSKGVLPAGGRGQAVMAQNHKIMARAAELHPGESIVEGSSIFKANEASLKHLQTNFDQVTAFENTAGKNLDVFLKQAKKVVDSGIPLINQPVRTVVGKMGGEDQVAFDTARTTALTEIAKVLNSSNASGVLSDSARHEVEGLIGKDATLAQIYSAANILKQDMANRHESYADQIKDIQNRMPNKNTAKPAQPKEQHPEEKKYPGFVVDKSGG